MELLEVFQHESNINLLEKAVTYELFACDDNKEINPIEKFIVSEINKNFEQNATHYQSLNLLSKFASKISEENLIKYFSHWNAKILQILTNTNKNCEKLILVCRTIGVLFISCKPIAELDKQVSIYHIKHVMGIIVELYCQTKNVTLLNLMTVLLYYYPESCARFQTSLNKVISLCIDYEETHSVLGAKCYALLVRAIERSFANTLKDNSVTLPDNSSAKCHILHQMSLCNYLSAILDELFQDLITPSDLFHGLPQSPSDTILHLSKIPCHNIAMYYTDLENRFNNISIYLCTLLKAGATAGKKFVLPNIILQVIHKGLAITPANFQINNDKKILLLVLPKLYIALLNILNALIISLGQELVSYALTIQQLILQSLFTAQSSNNSFITVRILSYKTLSIWLKHLGSLSGFQLLSDEFLIYILKDLTSSNKSTLTLNKKVHKRVTKTNLINKKFDEQSKSNLNNHSYNSDFNSCNDNNTTLHIQILLTIQSIITSTNHYLKQSFCDSITKVLVSSLHEQYIKHTCLSSDKTANEWKLQLLRTLRILQIHTHSLVLTPISHAIQIFGMAISQNKSFEIIEEASFGLAELSHIVYPTTPTLTLPLFNQLNSLNNSCSSSPVLMTSPVKRKEEIYKDDEDIPSKVSKQSITEELSEQDLISSISSLQTKTDNTSST